MANAGQTYGADDAYPLWVEAVDGELAVPRSGVARAEVRVDGTLVNSASQPCAAGSCGMEYEWDFVPTSVLPGPHAVTLAVIDHAGNRRERSWNIMVAPEEEPSNTESAQAPALVLFSDPLALLGPECRVSPWARSDAATVVRGTWIGGYEETEYYAGGAYRVSRCDQFGGFVRGQVVTPLEVPGGQIVRLPMADLMPDGGKILQTSALYPHPSDPIWAADWASHGAVLRADVMPPTTINGQEPAVASDEPTASAAGRCSGGDYNRAPFKWEDAEYDYVVNPANNPHGARTTKRLIDGHRTWNKTWDKCSKFYKKDRFMTTYRGTTDASIGVDTRDGRNLIAFSTGGIFKRDCGNKGIESVACARVLFDGESGHAEDADLIYDGRDRWYSGFLTDRCRKENMQRYDVWGITTHEVGHTAGLRHVEFDFGSVMLSDAATYCDEPYDMRVLGAGDVRGIRKIYPD